MTTAPPTVDAVPGVSVVGTTRQLGTDVDALLARFDAPAATDEAAGGRTDPEQPLIELVLVDDGATAGAFSALQETGARSGRVRSLQLAGLPDRRDHLIEAGLRMARGEFVLLLDGPDEVDADTVHRAYDEAVRRSLDVVLLTADDDVRPVTDPAALRGRALIRRSLLLDPPVVVAPLPAGLDLRQLTLVAVGRTAAVGVLPGLPGPVGVDVGLIEATGLGPQRWRPLATAARGVLDRHLPSSTAVEDAVFLAAVVGLDERAHEFVTVQLDAYAPRPAVPPPAPAEGPGAARARFADRLALTVEGAAHHWRRGRLVVTARARVLLDGVPLRGPGDVPADFADEVERAVDEAGPVVVAVRRGTSVRTAVTGTASSGWDAAGWQLSVEAEIDPRPDAPPAPATAILDLFVEVAALGRTLSTAIAHHGPPNLLALVDGTAVVAYRTKAGLLALDVGSTLHDAVAVALRGEVRFTAVGGRTALAVPGLPADGRTDLAGTMALGDRRLPVRLVHDTAGTRVLLEDGARVALDWPDRNTATDLDDLGRQYGLDQSSDHHDYLRDVQVEIDARLVHSLVIISGHEPDATAKAFAGYLPAATVHVLTVRPNARVEVTDRIRHRSCPTVADVAAYLQEIPPPEVIIEDGTNRSSHKLACFRLGFLHLADRGLYIAEDLHAHWMTQFRDADEGVAQYVDALLTLKSSPRDVLTAAAPDDRERARALHRVSHYGGFLVAERRGDHLVTVRDADLDRVLPARRGAGWGEVLLTRPPLSAPARSTLATSASTLAPDRFRTRIDCPELRARRYQGAICAPRQLVLLGDVVPSIAFHHPLDGRLKNRTTRSLAADVAELPDRLPTPEPLPGIYYHLDSEYPGHFGHFMTEDIGRLWAWPEAKQRYPELKLLISAAEPTEPLRAFQRTVLNALGIADHDIVTFDRPVQVEQLIGVSPMFHNGRYGHPELAAVWAAIRLRLVPDQPTPHRRVFVTRPPGSSRRCHNAAEVERLATDEGFELVAPERLEFHEQVRLFAEARAVAGWAGSGLFGSIFAPRELTRIVLASESYDATNEWLIAATQGGSYHHFWCPADRPQPAGGWSRWAFHSDFTFDLQANGDALRRVLRDS